MNSFTGVVTGALAKDVDMKYFPDGKAVANLSVAVNGWKKEDPPTWINITVWNKQAEFMAQNAAKGTIITATVTPITNEWETDDGEKRSRLVWNALSSTIVGPWATQEDSEETEVAEELEVVPF